MQNKKPEKKKVSHKKKVANQGKFRKSGKAWITVAPVGEATNKQKTAKDAHVHKSKNEITKVINKSI